MIPLTPRRVAELLSAREFLKLCAYFDLAHAAAQPASVILSGDRGLNGQQPVQFLKPRVAEQRFEVYGIERTCYDLVVTCKSGDGPLMALSYELSNLLTLPKRASVDRREKEAS